MSVLSQQQLEVELSLHPETVRVRDDSNWIHVGAMSVSKRYARYSIGFTHPIVKGSQFGRQAFELGQRRGWAIVFSEAETGVNHCAGWMHEVDGLEADRLVERLNAEIRARLVEAAAVGGDARPEVLTFHLGAEHAPDSPWGIETITLSCGGEFEYERRRSGKLLTRVGGRVDADRVSTLIADLSRTSFPTAPQAFFSPGASVATLITEPPFRRMDIELNAGLAAEGYGDILRTLTAFCTSLRNGKLPDLVGWHFAPE
jgi:hypothetical protein